MGEGVGDVWVRVWAKHVRQDTCVKTGEGRGARRRGASRRAVGQHSQAEGQQRAFGDTGFLPARTRCAGNYTVEGRGVGMGISGADLVGLGSF